MMDTSSYADWIVYLCRKDSPLMQSLMQRACQFMQKVCPFIQIGLKRLLAVHKPDKFAGYWLLCTKDQVIVELADI